MPAVRGNLDHGLRPDGEIDVAGKLGHQRNALHLDFDQSRIAEIIFAGDFPTMVAGP